MANFGKLNFNISLKPTSAFPLDARCYFDSFTEAEAAAATAEEVGSTNTIYYFGQKLVVVTDGTATWYTIQPDKTLKVDGSGSGGNIGGGGDMLKEVYDTNNNGKVDYADTAANALKLGGQSPTYYAKATDIPSADKQTKWDSKAEGEHKHTTADITDFATEMAKKADVSALEDAISDMTEIAHGKCASYVFDTTAALETWLGNTENTSNLKTGDVFLIRAIDVPDYWWEQIKEGVELSKYNEKDIIISDVGAARILETTKVTLTAISNAEIDTIVAK